MDPNNTAAVSPKGSPLSNSATSISSNGSNGSSGSLRNMKIDYKLVTLGAGGVGKSALLLRFVKSEFAAEYDPTIEDSYRKQVVVDDKVAFLDILDTAGQEEYAAMRSQYMRSGEGYILVYSIIKRETFDELSAITTQISRIREATGGKIPPIVVCGNKLDLEDQRAVKTEEGLAFAKSINGSFFETSALTKINVEEPFFELVRQIRRARAPQGKYIPNACIVL